MRKFYSLITLIIALVCCSGIAKADDSTSVTLTEMQPVQLHS